MKPIRTSAGLCARSGEPAGGNPVRVNQCHQIGRLPDGAAVESVLRYEDGAAVHRYRLVGGSGDGAEFTTLAELLEFIRIAPAAR